MAGAITVLGLYGILSVATVYLVTHGHPFWAVSFVLIMLCARISSK